MEPSRKIFFGSVLLVVIVQNAIQEQGSSTRSVLVGDNVTFECPISPVNGSAAVWLINGSIYDIVEVLEEYIILEAENSYQFIISPVKLWMNSTTYSCYDRYRNEEYLVGTIYVSFNLAKGPQYSTKAQLAKSFLIYCYDQLLSSDTVILWKINGTLFQQFQLPMFFYQQWNGIFIKEIKESMSGTTFQCYIHSNLLYKRSYWSSNIGTLTASKKGDSYLCEGNEINACKLQMQTFDFIHPLFNFTDNAFQIFWGDYNGVSKYFVVGKLEETSETNAFKLDVGTSTNYSLTNDQIQYFINIEAIDSFNQTHKSERYIKIQHTAITQLLYASPNNNACIPDIIPESYGIIFGFSLINDDWDDCHCSVVALLANCTCISTQYSVNYNNGKICLEQISLEMKQLKLFLFMELSIKKNHILYPGEEFVKTYKLIVTESPNPPSLELRNQSTCILNNYNEHSEILSYTVYIRDNLQGKYVYNINASSSNNEICNPLLYIGSRLLKVSCGPQEISATSTNEAGTSERSNVLELNSGSYSDQCICLKTKYNITTELINSTTQSIALRFSCETDYFLPSNVQIMIILKQKDYNYERKFICTKDFEVNVQSLKIYTAYNVTIESSTIMDSNRENCILVEGGIYYTNRDYRIEIYIAIAIGSTTLILCAISVIVILCIDTWQRRCARKTLN